MTTTIWDPTLSELAQACADAGHAPVYPADPGDVYRCAMDAFDELTTTFDTWVPPDAKIADLEGDLLAARQDLAAAREVLGATDSSAARLELWLLEQARIARESWADELCELAQRLEHLATELDRPRAQKARVARGLRLNADDLKRRADNARAARIVRPAANEEG